MAATVAGPLALGLGRTPNVWPSCTGFVEGLRLLSCAGIAAGASTAFGCGASLTSSLAFLMAGIVSLASIWTGFKSGLGSGFGTLIRGASNFTSGTFGSSTGGGGGIFSLGLGGSFLAGKISVVTS